VVVTGNRRSVDNERLSFIMRPMSPIYLEEERDEKTGSGWMKNIVVKEGEVRGEYFTLKIEDVKKAPLLSKMLAGCFGATDRNVFSDAEILAAAQVASLISDQVRINGGRGGKVQIRMNGSNGSAKVILEIDHSELSRKMGFNPGTWLRGLWHWWEE